jgi:phosphate acetyltransferase
MPTHDHFRHRQSTQISADKNDLYWSSEGEPVEQVHEDPEAALSEIVVRYHEVARRCDAVVVVGSDYTDVVNPSVLTFNARIAVNLGAPVLLAVNGHERSPETITHIAQRCLNEVSAAHARCAAIIANRCEPEYLEGVAEPARLRKGRGQPQRTRLGQGNNVFRWQGDRGRTKCVQP